MVAESLISNVIIPLRTSDTGDEALSMMDDFYVRHLPIVNNEQLLGLISENDILNFDAHEAVGSYSLSLIRPYVNAQDHIYEVMRQLAQGDLSVIPVVDDENNYLGVVTQEDLLNYFNLLPNRNKQFVIIAGQAHVSHLGVNRARFWHVMRRFLEMPSRIDTQPHD